MFRYSATIYFHSPFKSYLHWQNLLAIVLVMFAKALNKYLAITSQAAPSGLLYTVTIIFSSTQQPRKQTT
jgi:hypothetical protein